MIQPCRRLLSKCPSQRCVDACGRCYGIFLHHNFSAAGKEDYGKSLRCPMRAKAPAVRSSASFIMAYIRSDVAQEGHSREASDDANHLLGRSYKRRQIECRLSLSIGERTVRSSRTVRIETFSLPLCRSTKSLTTTQLIL